MMAQNTTKTQLQAARELLRVLQTKNKILASTQPSIPPG